MRPSFRAFAGRALSGAALAALCACAPAARAAEPPAGAAVALAALASHAAVHATAAGAALPRPRHVIVIVEENHTLAQIVGAGSAPYIDALVRRGALFTRATGVTHPSLPNYLALFAGLTNDNGDGCPATGFSPAAPNLASELHAAGLSFAGYAEAMPGAGSHVCAAGTYARKHAPWVAFSNVPAGESRPFAALPAYGRLPTVSFLIPDVDDDMHDGTIGAADDWLRSHLAPLLAWADRNDSLVVVTWDEGYDARNSIPTLFLGPMVRPGRYAAPIDHYNVLRTIEGMYGLPLAGRSRTAAAIAGCWRA